MPLYEFTCGSCGERFTVRRPFSKADDPADCPECSSDQTRRGFATFACVSKGSGGSHALGGGGCAGCAGVSCATCRR